MYLTLSFVKSSFDIMSIKPKFKTVQAQFTTVHFSLFSDKDKGKYRLPFVSIQLSAFSKRTQNSNNQFSNSKTSIMHHFCSKTKGSRDTTILLFENKSTVEIPIVEGQTRFTFI